MVLGECYVIIYLDINRGIKRYRNKESERRMLVSIRLQGLMTKVKLQTLFHGWYEFDFFSITFLLLLFQNILTCVKVLKLDSQDL